MANRIRASNPRGYNKGRSSKFREGFLVRQTHEEGRRTYQLKRCGNNNKDEDNSPKTFNDVRVQHVRRYAIGLPLKVYSCMQTFITRKKNSQRIFFLI